jgi:hypothetical protein
VGVRIARQEVIAVNRGWNKNSRDRRLLNNVRLLFFHCPIHLSCLVLMQSAPYNVSLKLVAQMEGAIKAWQYLRVRIYGLACLSSAVRIRDPTTTSNCQSSLSAIPADELQISYALRLLYFLKFAYNQRWHPDQQCAESVTMISPLWARLDGVLGNLYHIICALT